MLWLDTTEKDDDFSDDFWEQHRSNLESEAFWADKIKEYYQNPDKRLSLALANLPLPGAFNQAMLALRATIKQKKKSKSNYTSELEHLYWLAAISSFSIPYSECLKQPGFNVLESIPGSIIKSLKFEYKTLGYQELSLLSKTDIKWLIKEWGEPKSHTTLHQEFNHIWKEYEKALPKRQKVQLQKTLARLM